jgi:hypothetical protein
MTIQEIKNQITQEWMSDPTIRVSYQLDPNKTFEEQFSKVSLESIIFYICAYVVWLRETALDSWREDVDATALATRYGTKEWWHKIALAWQDGDMTSVIDGAVAYSIIDETKQKVKFCAVVEEGRTLYLRVAGGTASALTPLTNDELIRLQSYLNDVKPLGIRSVAQSYPADNLAIQANVYYDGERILAELESEVNSAIDHYLSSIVFGGLIFKSKLIDAIQSVNGVKDVEIISITATPSGGSSVVVGRSYQPKAGYAKVSSYAINLIIE